MKRIELSVIYLLMWAEIHTANRIDVVLSIAIKHAKARKGLNQFSRYAIREDKAFSKLTNSSKHTFC